MKFYKKVLSMILLVSCFACMFAGLSFMSYAAGGENLYYIEPRLGDGASVSQKELDDLYVEGILYKNGYFTFTKTRTLSFTVKLEDGWRYCSEYSSVFSTDTGNLTVTEGINSVTFKYRATAGRSIKFETLAYVCVNTTASVMPKLYITMKNGVKENQITKESWVDCDVELKLGTKKYASGNYVGGAQIKGRGNQSWGKAQRPYSINLNEKASLLDIPATRKYAIVTTIEDKSFVRNLVMYNTCQDLLGIDYVVRSQPVEVYFDGSYNGMYTLVERIRLSESKVNEKQASETYISGAYILEKTVDGKMDNGEANIIAPFLGHPNSAGQLDRFTFKDPDVVNEAMIAYCTEAIYNAHNAIMSSSDTSYKQYIDTSSWLDFLIMEEVSNNVDGEFKTSTFFLLRENSQVLEFTSLWDFDLALGNPGADYNNDASGKDQNGNRVNITGTINGTATSGFMVISASCPWYQTLYKKNSFKKAVKERYSEYRYTLLNDLYYNIDYYAAYMKNSVETVANPHVKANEVASEVEILKSWLIKRIKWLDTQWLNDRSTCYAYDIAKKVSGKGSVEASNSINRAYDGEYKSFNITPDSGYTIQQVTFNGRNVTDEVILGVYRTPYITHDCELTVTFAQEDIPTPSVSNYNIFISGDVSNGTIVTDINTAEMGTLVTVTATPNEGYELGYITVDGKILSTDSFIMPARDVNISAQFNAVISTRKNKESLLKVSGLMSNSVLKSTANLSTKSVADTYLNLCSDATRLYDDINAIPETINSVMVEMMRVYGIMRRSTLDSEALAIFAEVAQLCDVSEEIITAALAETDIALAWNILTDACCIQPADILLDSIYSSCAELNSTDYKAVTFAALQEALGSANVVLGNDNATQSQIDAAAAGINKAYMGLEKSLKSSQDNSTPSIQRGSDESNVSLYQVIRIATIALGTIAFVLITVAVITIIKKKRTK